MGLHLLGSLRGLRVQLLLWTVLPLTLVLVAVAIIGITTHQNSMRTMVEELNARSARLSAAHLNDGLADRVTLLRTLATSPWAAAASSAREFFDGGLARFDAAGNLTQASPSPDAWQTRPRLDVTQANSAGPAAARYSAPYFDSALGRQSLLVGLPLDDGGIIAGAVSLGRLGLIQTASPAADAAHTNIPANTVAFLVDGSGQVIFHPDAAQIGQNWKDHASVQAAIFGLSGATYHQEPDGRELVEGYAPIVGPGWGLIVQEPWERLIAPLMRVSLLAPLAVVAAAVVSGLAVSFGLHYVVRPLQALDRQATRVAWGDFSAVDQPVGGVQEIEDLRRTLAVMAGQIQRYQSGMRDYMAAVTAAQEEERRRLARELHDETVQSLIALGHRVEMVQKLLDKDPERARQRLAELSRLTADTQQEVRRFSRALRPLYLEDLGFVPALEMLAQEIEREHRLPVSVSVEGYVRRLPADLELTAYRAVQEGLNNVVRHAAAQSVQLAVIFGRTELSLRIQDDGAGFSPPVNPAELAQTGHFGLMGLHERALLFGGRLDIESSPGRGATVLVSLKIPPAT